MQHTLNLDTQNTKKVCIAITNRVALLFMLTSVLDLKIVYLQHDFEYYVNISPSFG